MKEEEKQQEKKLHVDVSDETQIFCEELILEILIRAHAKTLFRSKCVCKNWQSLISDQSFINRYIKRSKSLPPSLTGFFYRTGNIVDPNDDGHVKFLSTGSLNDTNDLNVLNKGLSFLSEINGSVYVVDSNNGLLLCAKKPKLSGLDYVSSTPICYFVCNPVTKQWVALPEPKHCDYGASALLHCYNLDELCAQKTEFMVYCFCKENPNFLQVEIFSSKAGKWYKCNTCYYNWLSKEFNCMTLLNGSVYWLQEDGNMVVYDVKKESICFVKLPHSDIFGRWILHLGVSGGSVYVTERNQTCFFVWVLVDGLEFCLSQTIEVENLINDPKRISTNQPQVRLRFKILGFHQAAYQLVFVGINPYKAALYCVNKRRLEHISDLHPSTFCNFYLRLFPYSLPAWPTCIPFLKNS
ncbi:hypothetical protein IFM89_019347 [Coptis chinensis]|uniref:F-box domain-containing protein n=1 Tax=Coptis chinensis TaxID=261450 RepID=A0A835I3J1_9MAGN|nr:hypothetical protein IFM89_019347 [Coptis chinensis]